MCVLLALVGDSIMISVHNSKAFAHELELDMRRKVRTRTANVVYIRTGGARFFRTVRLTRVDCVGLKSSFQALRFNSSLIAGTQNQAVFLNTT